VADQSRPIVALRGIHRLGNPEPVAEEVLPERQGGLPIDHGRRTWDVLATWVRDDVCRSERDSAAESLWMFRPGPGLGKLRSPASRRWLRATQLSWSSWSWGEPVDRDSAAFGRGPQAGIGQLQAAYAGRKIVGVWPASIDIGQELLPLRPEPVAEFSIVGICAH
jgi:hypothetical protein